MRNSARPMIERIIPVVARPLQFGFFLPMIERIRPAMPKGAPTYHNQKNGIEIIPKIKPRIPNTLVFPSIKLNNL